jgi:hypothetical protein
MDLLQQVNPTIKHIYIPQLKTMLEIKNNCTPLVALAKVIKRRTILRIYSRIGSLEIKFSIKKIDGIISYRGSGR